MTRGPKRSLQESGVGSRGYKHHRSEAFQAEERAERAQHENHADGVTMADERPGGNGAPILGPLAFEFVILRVGHNVSDWPLQ